MFMGIAESLAVAVSLCADCFAVSLCSSVTLGRVRRTEVARIALSFAVIQTSLLLVGWLFGSLLVGLIVKISHIVGFLLLLYVGGSMLLEGIKGGQEALDLNGWRNVVIGGVATSMDALAVGVAQSMSGEALKGVLPLLVSVFLVTALSVVAGIWGGRTLGAKAGRWAEIAGGVVLVVIACSFLI